MTQVGNLDACFLTGNKRLFYGGLNNWPEARACINDELTRAAEGGHNVAAYVAAVLHYRTNAGITNDDTARWHIKQAEVTIAGRPMLSNKGCLLCHEKAYAVL
jgi:hypothetical protein